MSLARSWEFRMNTRNTLKNCLLSIASLIDSLKEADLKKLESGDYKLSLKLVKTTAKKSNPKEKVPLEKSTLDLIIEKLLSAKTREEGSLIVDTNLKNKSDLELLAKHLDVAVIASDKVITIKERIVDATVGARLRSSAIQGKEI